MVYDCKRLDEQARLLFKEERALNRLDGWFILRETILAYEETHKNTPKELLAAEALCYALERLPLSLSNNAVFAGTQRDAFAQSYALINPNFKLSTFNGYCDPTAVFNDIEPNEEFTAERIERVKKLTEKSDYVRTLKEVYANVEMDTKEVAYFIEQVTGHLIPDFRKAIKLGLNAVQAEIGEKLKAETDEKKKINLQAFSLEQITVTVVGGKANGASSVTVDKNGSVTVVAGEAPEGKTFKGWSKDGGQTIISEEESYTFNATESVTLTAIYGDTVPGGEQPGGEQPEKTEKSGCGSTVMYNA